MSEDLTWLKDAKDTLGDRGVDRAWAMRRAEELADEKISLMYPDTSKMVARLHRGRIISSEFRSMVYP